MPMLPDERFGNRTPYTGGSPLPPPQLPIPAGVDPSTDIRNVLSPITPTDGKGSGNEFKPPVPGPTVSGGASFASAGVETLPTDLIGDVPPPPIPTPPITGSGVAGIHGTEAGTLARPGQRAAAPFRTSAYTPKPQRFGPGVPTAGGDAGVQGLGLDPESAAELLRQLAAGRQQ